MKTLLCGLDPGYMSRLAIIVNNFVDGLAYLERLWVAQELYEARGRAWVLCEQHHLLDYMAKASLPCGSILRLGQYTTS